MAYNNYKNNNRKKHHNNHGGHNNRNQKQEILDRINESMKEDTESLAYYLSLNSFDALNLYFRDRKEESDYRGRLEYLASKKKFIKAVRVLMEDEDAVGSDFVRPWASVLANSIVGTITRLADEGKDFVEVTEETTKLVKKLTKPTVKRIQKATGVSYAVAMEVALVDDFFAEEKFDIKEFEKRMLVVKVVNTLFKYYATLDKNPNLEEDGTKEKMITAGQLRDLLVYTISDTRDEEYDIEEQLAIVALSLSLQSSKSYLSHVVKDGGNMVSEFNDVILKLLYNYTKKKKRRKLLYTAFEKIVENDKKKNRVYGRQLEEIHKVAEADTSEESEESNVSEAKGKKKKDKKKKKKKKHGSEDNFMSKMKDLIL